MSANNKTDFLQLNQWDGGDKPRREDFNEDNRIIDESFFEHCTDTTSHVIPSERTKWNSPYFAGSYFGNGETKRVIDTKCPFSPTFGFIFAIATAPSVTRFNSSLVQHYSAIITPRGSTIGASLSGKEITVTNYATPILDDEYATMNAVGCTYLYFLFR